MVIRNTRTGSRIRVKKWTKNERHESADGYFMPDNVHVLMTFRSHFREQPVADRTEWVVENEEETK